MYQKFSIFIIVLVVLVSSCRKEDEQTSQVDLKKKELEQKEKEKQLKEKELEQKTKELNAKDGGYKEGLSDEEYKENTDTHYPAYEKDNSRPPVTDDSSNINSKK